jgi:hypothetical protein
VIEGEDLSHGQLDHWAAFGGEEGVVGAEVELERCELGFAAGANPKLGFVTRAKLIHAARLWRGGGGGRVWVGASWWIQGGFGWEIFCIGGKAISYQLSAVSGQRSAQEGGSRWGQQTRRIRNPPQAASLHYIELRESGRGRLPIGIAPG